MNQYCEVNPISREEAMAAFASEERERICDALVRLAYHEPDWQWVQEQCLFWARYPDVNIQGAAVTCLGHLARIHAKLDVEKVLPLLRELFKDPSVASRVDDAL